MNKPGRRTFLKRTGGGLLSAALARAQDAPPAFRRTQIALKPAGPLAADVTRTWIGPEYWANRLQDWRLDRGRMECLTGASGDEGRTVAALTLEMARSAGAAHLSVRTGTLADAGGGGFSGFLIGAGAGNLDYRAAALVQEASGIGGGMFCVFESDGKIRFREHTSEQKPLEYAGLAADEETAARPRVVGEDVELRLDVTPSGAGKCELRLTAWDPANGAFLAGALRRGVAEADILGGVSLVSSPSPGVAGARYWFRDLRYGGTRIAVHPERAFGPILGTLYSLNRAVLKLSVQLAPVAETAPQTVKLQYRPKRGAWKNAPDAVLGPGFTALFRVADWDFTRDWEYRVQYAGAVWGGSIPKDPAASDSLSIALFSCVICTTRSLEGAVFKPEIPGEEFLGRYTHKAIYFPHDVLVRNSSIHKSDLLVFCGDQLYETSPTRKEWDASPTLDYLYKWFLWVWSFREMSRNTPTIVMVDDHDVFHGNIWGAGGRHAPDDDQDQGGYRCSPEWVNMVQRTQCLHNPDSFDPAPVEQNISVYYGAFKFGGVSFAILEDRKFKSAPPREGRKPDPNPILLGARQEKFLAEWAKDWDGASAKIVLTQTAFCCVQTSPDGRPLADADSNGNPKPGRDAAIRLWRDAGALVLSGDQHLASVVRHGIENFTDGVVQFSGPGGGTNFQRWFQPAKPLPNAGAAPHTGDWVDGFGNKFRVLAVANPKVSFKDYRRHKTGRGQGLGDRNLKSEGYGLVRVDRKKKEFVLECWSWDTNPKAAGARQFEGWPVRLPWEKAGKPG